MTRCIVNKERGGETVTLTTDHEVGDHAEDGRSDGAHDEDVRQDFAQEVHRDSVVAADVLVPIGFIQ